MKSPFPGMDPYLEQSGLWEEVHRSLVHGIQQFLISLLSPRYQTVVEYRTYHAFLPPPAEQGADIPNIPGDSAKDIPSNSHEVDLASVADHAGVSQLPTPQEVSEKYLEIRQAQTQEVVTVIEIMSLGNKWPGDGKKQYERKRHEIMASLANLIEIDLLRGGDPPGINNYRIVISRSAQRPRADIYRFSMRQPIPSFPIPLRPGEPEPTLQLNQILHQVYDQNDYNRVIDYQQPPPPPELFSVDLDWVKQIVEGAST
jgi:hypothetical protein